jgi:hypothetical protein
MLFVQKREIGIKNVSVRTGDTINMRRLADRFLHRLSDLRAGARRNPRSDS